MPRAQILELEPGARARDRAADSEMIATLANHCAGIAAQTTSSESGASSPPIVPVQAAAIEPIRSWKLARIT